MIRCTERPRGGDSRGYACTGAHAPARMHRRACIGAHAPARMHRRMRASTRACMGGAFVGMHACTCTKTSMGVCMCGYACVGVHAWVCMCGYACVYLHEDHNGDETDTVGRCALLALEQPVSECEDGLLSHPGLTCICVCMCMYMYVYMYMHAACLAIQVLPVPGPARTRTGWVECVP